jgi:hypothetical protein
MTPYTLSIYRSFLPCRKGLRCRHPGDQLLCRLRSRRLEHTFPVQDIYFISHTSYLGCPVTITFFTPEFPALN